MSSETSTPYTPASATVTGNDTVSLADEIKKYDTEKLIDLREVLTKYDIGGNVRLKNYGTLVVDSLEAMRNEYVVAILHTAINVTRDATGDELSMRPEYEVIGDESTGRVDFAIKLRTLFALQKINHSET
ncbi:hypothetical protein GLOIN_2v1727104 [Rhizophagus clarus]|uniref:Uncharacterized protein n=1 Tax=Rhizophagus clarus TaxID=94130 RepID=A0A8H3L3K1_9GLOM|nr:hypothetical protein GLOIN_2v1727104 [Rhizophagus clarus]